MFLSPGKELSEESHEHLRKWFESLKSELRDTLSMQTKIKLLFLAAYLKPMFLVFPKETKHIIRLFLPVLAALTEHLKRESDIESLGFIILIHCMFHGIPDADIDILRKLADYLGGLTVPGQVAVTRKYLYEYFTPEDADKIIAMAAQTRGRDLIQNYDEDALGWNWYQGSSRNLTEMLKFGLSNIRRLIKGGRYDAAVNFNSRDLGTEIQKNLDEIRSILASQDEVFISLFEEREFWNRVLDCYASAKQFVNVTDLTATNLHQSSQTRPGIFEQAGTLNYLHTHEELVDKLLALIFPGEGKLVYEMDIDSKNVSADRKKELHDIQAPLAQKLVVLLIALVRTCKDVTLQARETTKVSYKIGVYCKLLSQLCPSVYKDTVSNLASICLHNRQILKTLV